MAELLDAIFGQLAVTLAVLAPLHVACLIAVWWVEFRRDIAFPRRDIGLVFGGGMGLAGLSALLMLVARSS